MRDDKQIEAMRECRHCGWLCAPKNEQSKSWYPLRQEPAVPEGGRLVPSLLSDEEMAALRRVYECFEDGAGWDVPAEMMKRLARIGVVRWCGGTRYEITECGNAMLAAAPAASAEDVERVAQVIHDAEKAAWIRNGGAWIGSTPDGRHYEQARAALRAMGYEVKG